MRAASTGCRRDCKELTASWIGPPILALNAGDYPNLIVELGRARADRLPCPPIQVAGCRSILSKLSARVKQLGGDGSHSFWGRWYGWDGQSCSMASRCLARRGAPPPQASTREMLRMGRAPEVGRESIFTGVSARALSPRGLSSLAVEDAASRSPWYDGWPDEPGSLPRTLPMGDFE
jgi:hypothetical protein